MNNHMNTIINTFKDQNILIIGDAMLDIYLKGTSGRICREAPVPIVDVQSQVEVAGGAANTAVNVANLGGNAYFLSVVGNDWESKVLLQTLKQQQVHTDTIISERQRKTLTKQRVMADNHMLVRFDYGSTQSITETTEQKIIDKLLLRYSQMDAVIISDYGYGILTDKIIFTLQRLQQSEPKILIIDSKYLDKYKMLSPTAVKPNYQEAVALLGITQIPPVVGKRLQQIELYREYLLEKTGADIAAVTVDVEGSLIFAYGKPAYRTYTKPVEHSKSAGAGDTYTATLALALASTATTQTAAELAAAAATIVVQKEGTATCNREELQLFFSEQDKQISSNPQLELLLKQYRNEGKRIVFTNGCFDILHSGHVNYLNRAKHFGDILIIGLNSDESIKRLKGPERPINTLSDRLQVLSGLSSVDHIVPFTENTPINLIKKIRPDVYVKGGDYTRETLPEVPVVEGYGGHVELVPFVKDRSTTEIIRRIRKNTFDGKQQYAAR